MGVVLRSVAYGVAIAAAANVALAAEKAAEVVSVQGQAESRPDEKAAWSAAAPKQALYEASYVRTGAYSRMGLIFSDRTQVRLAEKTVMQIKPSRERTTLRLEQGRSWSQTNAVPANLYIETPSATAAIRGTDWEVEVQPGGVSLLTVFSGEVAFFNPYGSVSVVPGEQARAEPGKAPVKILIANPRDRVQWVTAYSIDPSRHLDANASPALRNIAQLVREGRLEAAFGALQPLVASPDAPVAAFLIASDLMVHEGRIDRARDWVRQGLARHANDPRLVAQLVRIDLAAGEFGQARSALAQAPAQAFDVRLAAGDLARAEGDGHAARREYTLARDERPADDRPWYGLGVVDSEREDVARARGELAAALERNPHGAGYQGEVGTLETFADDFRRAQAAFDAALAANPADYVAWTGQGLLLLKRGHAQEALDSLLRASLLEPKYARAQMLAGVAHYQLGHPKQALERLARASELDPKDPLPYLLASIIETDLFQPTAAIASARRAMELLPYLKSLNQVANDRQGSANLGRSLSFFGLEEWAQNRAQESYYPYWGGSHLFLSDRYAGDFDKNSELVQGFITDPLAFGGSNRFQTLVPTVGHYGQVLLGYSWGTNVFASYPVARANGLFDAGVPVAYLLDIDRPDFHFTGGPQGINGPDRGRTITAAVGTKPTHELGLFAYGFDDKSRGEVLAPGAGFDFNSDQRTRSGTLGASYRFGPQNQLWLRGTWFRTEIEDAGMADTSQLDSKLVSRLPEYSIRHTFDAGAHQLTWGYEDAHRKAVNDFSLVDPGAGQGGFTTLRFDERSRAAFVSDRWDDGRRLLVQGDLWWQDTPRTSSNDSVFVGPDFGTIALPTTVEDRGLRRTTPRVGLRYKVTDATLVRLAYQDWIKPVSLATLGPVATAGIPVDDRLVARGGRIERGRVQLESEPGTRLYWTAFADFKRIDNRLFAQKPFFVEDDEKIRRLRDFDYGRVAAGDLYEFVSAPDFQGAHIRIAGAAVNGILTRTLSASARYENTVSRNTADDPALHGNAVPYLPRHALALGLTWVSPQRIYVSARGVYRTERFTDEKNLAPLDPGWTGNLDVFWESADKRVRVRVGVANAFRAAMPEQYNGNIVINF